jgi:hypothetical protein
VLLPTVDEILYQMNGGEVFTKLDMNQGFHQIELEEDSREITTFVTHKGLYRYKRLMFRINAAPEKYQQVVSQVFHDEFFQFTPWNKSLYSPLTFSRITLIPNFNTPSSTAVFFPKKEGLFPSTT